MKTQDRELLALVASLNQSMGAAVVRLTDDMRDGMLPAHTLRELGAICDDLAAALHDRAAEIDSCPAARSPLVIEGDTDIRPMCLAPTLAHRTDLHDTHQDADDIEEGRCAEQ